MLTKPLRPLRIIALLAALAGLVAGGTLLGLPQGDSVLAKDKLADGALVPDPAKLAAEGALKDIWQGDAKAPNTIYEYSSLTCGHCAHFHQTILPELKKKYIETGKLRYTIREYPLDNLAVIGFMLARCDEGKYYVITEDLYKHQEEWAFVAGPFEKLKERAKALGFDDGKFMTCVRDQVQLDKIVKVHDLAAKEFDVSSTPTLFVNGHIVRGPRELADVEKYLTGIDGK
jgi:protein-disulfide isomerase